MTVTIRALMNGRAELAKIDAEAEAKREVLRRELENAVAARRLEVGAIVEMVGGLTLPDDVIGGVLLLAAERYQAEPQSVEKYKDAFAGRFPGAAKRKRGRRPRATGQGNGAGAEAVEAIANAAAGQQTAGG